MAGLAGRAVQAVPAAVTYDPLTLSPLFWFDAADSASVTLNGSTVSQWNDKSGNGYHLTQGTAGSQPTYTSAGQNGRNIITFDGTSDTLSRSTTPTVTQPFSVWIAMKWNALTAEQRLMMCGSNLQIYLAPTFTMYAGSNAAVSGGDSTSVPIVYGLVFNGSSSVARRNGSVISSSLAVGASSGSGLRVGSHDNLAANTFASMSVYEIIGKSGTFSAGDITALEAYLKAKWGTP